MSHMLHVTSHVTCHKFQVAKKYTKDPVCYTFLESSCKIQFNGHDKYVTCHICYMLLVTNIKLKRMLPNTSCVIYFWKAHAKSSLMVMIKMSHVTCVTCHMAHVLHVTCHTCYMSQI